MPGRRRCAPSPSIRRTRRKPSAEACRRASTSSSSWSRRGREDWLASACRQGVRCDVLVVSGHYDGGSEFFSDQLDKREHLPVDELERASCSGVLRRTVRAAEGGLPLRLQHARFRGQPVAVVRDRAQPGSFRPLARGCRARGAHPAPASWRKQPRPHAPGVQGCPRDLRFLVGGAPGSDRRDDPAASSPGRGPGEVATGRVSTRLLSNFSAHSMVATSGIGSAGPMAEHGQDICRFSDDRRTPAQRADFIHELLGREMAEVRLFLDRIERYAARLAGRRARAARRRRRARAHRGRRSSRQRYLDFARDADQVSVRARMLDLAQSLGWLTPGEKWTEAVRMFGDQLARDAPERRRRGPGVRAQRRRGLRRGAAGPSAAGRRIGAAWRTRRCSPAWATWSRTPACCRP